MTNSLRKDIELLPDNFRGQTTHELLPLGEIPLYRHNGQIFTLDSSGDGSALISAGDTWLLPYWMGRYLGVISPPDRIIASGIQSIPPFQGISTISIPLLGYYRIGTPEMSIHTAPNGA
jgi:hypothetical protein